MHQKIRNLKKSILSRTSEDFLPGNTKDVKKFVARELLRMRAGDDQLDVYANQYLLTSEERNEEPDWDKFNSLWEERWIGNEEMAALLSETLGVEYEEALAWVTEY